MAYECMRTLSGNDITPFRHFRLALMSKSWPGEMPNQICERTRLLSRPSSLCSLCSVRKCESVPDLLFSTGLFFHVTFIVTFRLLSASLIAVSVKSILIKQQRPFLFFFFRSISEESKICQPAIIQPPKKTNYTSSHPTLTPASAIPLRYINQKESTPPQRRCQRHSGLFIMYIKADSAVLWQMLGRGWHNSTDRNGGRGKMKDSRIIIHTLKDVQEHRREIRVTGWILAYTSWHHRLSTCLDGLPLGNLRWMTTHIMTWVNPLQWSFQTLTLLLCINISS